MTLRHAARDGRRGHPRPARRRLRALQRRRHLDRAALREDALRQRAAGARLPARLAGLRRAPPAGGVPATRSTGRCARCAAPRAASTRRSTPTPRASRAATTCGRIDELTARARRGRARGDRLARRRARRGNFADPHHPEPGLNVLQTRGSAVRGRPARRGTRERIRARLLQARASARAPRPR